MNDFKKSLRATARIGIDNRGTKPEKAVKIEIFYDRKTMRYPTGVYLTLEE